MTNKPHPNHPRSPAIHKKNELIRGNLLGLSLHGNKAMNALYYYITKNELEAAEYFTITYSLLRKMMRLHNDGHYVDIINTSLRELTDSRLELRNYKSLDDNEEYYRLYLAFLADFRVAKKHNEGKTVEQWEVKVYVYNEMRAIIQRAKTEGNWTQIEWFKYSNKFVSKYSIGLYEYLKSFEGNSKYIKIDLIELNQIFGLIKAKTEGNRKTKNRNEITKLLQLSKVLLIVNRCVKEIVAKSDLKDLTHEPSKKTKSITFYLIKQNLIAAKKLKNIIKKSANKIIIDDVGTVPIDPKQRKII